MKIEKCKLWEQRPLPLPPPLWRAQGNLNIFWHIFIVEIVKELRAGRGQRGVWATCLRLQHLAQLSSSSIIDSSYRYAIRYILYIPYICIYIDIGDMLMCCHQSTRKFELSGRRGTENHGEIEKNCLSIWEKCVAKQIVAVSSWGAGGDGSKVEKVCTVWYKYLKFSRKHSHVKISQQKRGKRKNQFRPKITGK